MPLILVVDDEKDIRDLIADTLRDEGYGVMVAKNAAQAIELLAQEKPQAVLLDIWLEGSSLDGLGVLRSIKNKYIDIPVIMISGHGNIKTAVDAIKLGAYDFIEKPFKIERLLLTLERALEAYALSDENKRLQKSDLKKIELSGKSKQIKTVIKQCKAVANLNSRVLILGESGTGRDTLARFMHENSSRARKPFIAVNTVNFSKEQLEKELFGIEMEENFIVGAIEKADGGSLFIDEITHLAMDMQYKLLNLLQNNAFSRVGSSNTIKSNIRFMFGSDFNIEKCIKNNGFSESLYSRINVASVKMVSLRDRKEDIAEISDLIIQQLSKELDAAEIILEPETISLLSTYEWPGNIIQLRNVVEWLMILHSDKKSISPDMLPHNILSDIGESVSSIDIRKVEIFNKNLKEAREIFEREYIITQLKRFSGNISKTAEYIGMDRTALHRKIRYLHISIDEAV